MRCPLGPGEGLEGAGAAEGLGGAAEGLGGATAAVLEGGDR